MKLFIASLAFVALSATVALTNNMDTTVAEAPAKTIYDFSIKSLSGGMIDFSHLFMTSRQSVCAIVYSSMMSFHRIGMIYELYEW